MFYTCIVLKERNRCLNLPIDWLKWLKRSCRKMIYSPAIAPFWNIRRDDECRNVAGSSSSSCRSHDAYTDALVPSSLRRSAVIWAERVASCKPITTVGLIDLTPSPAAFPNLLNDSCHGCGNASRDVIDSSVKSPSSYMHIGAALSHQRYRGSEACSLLADRP